MALESRVPSPVDNEGRDQVKQVVCSSLQQPLHSTFFTPVIVYVATVDAYKRFNFIGRLTTI